MRRTFTTKKVIKKLFYSLGIMVSVSIIVALLLSFVPVNSGFAQAKKPESIEIYLTSNGVHTDLILPVSTPYLDWRHYLDLKHFAGADSSFTHVGFGWGDRLFYMETPEWSDLTLKVALQAALWPSPSAMHVEYIRRPLKPTRHQRPIQITPAQYTRLVSYIKSSFQQQNNMFILIPDKGYSSTDNFYEARETFFLPKNCNYWVNKGLKAAGLKAAFFAPFPFAIMRHYR